MSASTTVLNTGLTFSQFITTIIIIALSAIAVKVTFSFDVNKYQEDRRKMFASKAKNACLHFEFIPTNDGQVEVHFFFVSPSGTLSYICQRCGLVRLHIDQDEQQRTADYYIKNIDEYHKQNKKFEKLVKKAGHA